MLTFILWNFRMAKMNNSHGREMTSCTAWEYDRSKFSQTLASEFDLVCGREKLLSIGQTVYFFGQLCSGPTFGVLTDKFGRKPMLIAAMLMMATSGLGSGLIPNFEMFLVFRFFTAMGGVGEYLIVSILSIIISYVHCMFCTRTNSFSGVQPWNDLHVGALWQQLDYLCWIGIRNILGDRMALPWGPGICPHQLATTDHGNICPRITSCLLLLHPAGITQVAPISRQSWGCWAYD